MDAKYGTLVTRHLPSGESYRVWEVPMPTVPPRLLNCSFYVYKTIKDAEEGNTKNGGGCGFFVGIPDSVGGWHPYAVTCKHIIDSGGLVLRATRTDGSTVSPLQTQLTAWTTVIDDDIAVLPLEIRHINVLPEATFLPETNQ